MFRAPDPTQLSRGNSENVQNSTTNKNWAIFVDFSFFSVVLVFSRRITNSRWWTAAILKNRKTAISPQCFYLARNLAQWRKLTIWTVPAVKITNISKSQIADGRPPAVLKNRKTAIVSPTVWPIGTKFGMLTHIDKLYSPQMVVTIHNKLHNWLLNHISC